MFTTWIVLFFFFLLWRKPLPRDDGGENFQHTSEKQSFDEIQSSEPPVQIHDAFIYSRPQLQFFETAKSWSKNSIIIMIRSRYVDK